MKSKNPRALIIYGDGIHCEGETSQAFLMARFDSEIRHINDLISEKLSIDEVSSRYSVIVFPGGDSFSNDLGAGKVLSLKIQYQLGWDFMTYVQRGGLVLGICNGFQALIRMGVFGKDFSITDNSQGKFVDTWTKVTPSGTKCVWLKGLGTLDLPIRHGEGRVVISATRRSEILEKMERQGTGCLRYESNPNGSEERLAGLCDPSGRIFGLMPHPESFIRWTSHPEWSVQPARASAPGHGLALFENAYQEALKSGM
jgi:phosphoribosylformylglycinamidine (FGAM) synthase-like amidotransferase family enzyme